MMKNRILISSLGALLVLVSTESNSWAGKKNPIKAIGRTVAKTLGVDQPTPEETEKRKLELLKKGLIEVGGSFGNTHIALPAMHYAKYSDSPERLVEEEKRRAKALCVAQGAKDFISYETVPAKLTVVLQDLRLSSWVSRNSNSKNIHPEVVSVIDHTGKTSDYVDQVFGKTLCSKLGLTPEQIAKRDTDLKNARIKQAVQREPSKKEMESLKNNTHYTVSDSWSQKYISGSAQFYADNANNPAKIKAQELLRAQLLCKSLGRGPAISYDTTEASFGIHMEIFPPSSTTALVNEKRFAEDPTILKVSTTSGKEVKYKDRVLTKVQCIESTPNLTQVSREKIIAERAKDASFAQPLGNQELKNAINSALAIAEGQIAEKKESQRKEKISLPASSLEQREITAGSSLEAVTAN